MKIYREGNIEEWSRKLRCKHGNRFRMYKTKEETLERWAYHLSYLYNHRFNIREDEAKTLNDWSKLIGG